MVARIGPVAVAGAEASWVGIDALPEALRVLAEPAGWHCHCSSPHVPQITRFHSAVRTETLPLSQE